MIHKYNNTHGNKMININHPIHEQNIYDKIIVLLTSRLLQTNIYNISKVYSELEQAEIHDKSLTLIVDAMK